MFTAFPARVAETAALLMGAAFMAGCVDASRLSSRCELTGDSAFVIDMRDRAQRSHLKYDVRIADENSVRFADAARARVGFGERWTATRAACGDTLYAKIESLHGVSRATINAARHMRDGWIDALFVWLPSALVFATGCVVLLRKVCVRFTRRPFAWEDGLLLLWLALTVSAVGVGGAHLWGWTVDEWRLRTHHLSFRARYLPVGPVAGRAYAATLLLFGILALREVRSALASKREPLRRQTAV